MTDAVRSAICKWIGWPFRFFRCLRINLDQSRIADARRRLNFRNAESLIFGIHVLGDDLNDEIAGVNSIRTACADSCLPAVGENGEVGAMAPQMKLIQRANPDPRSCRNLKFFTHRNAFFPRVESLVPYPRLYRILDHSRLYGPLCEYLHSARVDGERDVLEHNLEARSILVLDPAHPCVVVGVADGFDRLLEVVLDCLRPRSLLNAECAQVYAVFFHEAVHPVRP